MRLFSRCTTFNPRFRNLGTMHCQVLFSLISLHRGISGFRSHRKNLRLNAKLFRLIDLFRNESHVLFGACSLCRNALAHDYGMIGIGRGLGNFIVMFPESVVCVRASLAYVVAPTAERNGVKLLFAWHGLLFFVWWCSTTKCGYCQLVGRVSRASYNKRPQR